MMKRINRILMVVAISMATVNANAWPWVSPYAYCMGNPVKFVDPDGRKIVFPKGTSEEFKKQYYTAVNYLRENNCYEKIEIKCSFIIPFSASH